jgi:hypothetical protein
MTASYTQFVDTQWTFLVILKNHITCTDSEHLYATDVIHFKNLFY